MQCVRAALHVVRHGPGELDLPAAIAQIVVMEMDRAVVMRCMTPALLVSAPSGANHGAHRCVDQRAMASMRTDVVDRVAVDAEREIPAGMQLWCQRFERHSGIWP